jgi:arylsulfatase A-like enzyme
MIDRRNFLANTSSLAAILACNKLFASTSEKKQNFVFFLVDDLGWTDAGCFGSGFYNTPNIDRLADQGIKFTDAYAACPVCSPTRASIMTGKYPARLDITNYFTGKKKGKLIPAPYINRLPLEEITIAEAFKDAGYKTFFAGKWHLGKKKYYPEHHGFDVNKGGNHTGLPVGGYFSPYLNQELENGPIGEYLTDRLTEESARFIENNTDKPFMLFLSHYSVHVPLQAKKEMVDKFKTRAASLPKSDIKKFKPEGKRKARQVQDHPVYAAMIESVDQSLGNIMDKLTELGLDQDTAIIFMSDNGGLSTAEGSPTSNTPLRAGKGWLYEGGIRVPMIISWPGQAKAGSVCNEPVTSTDFFPTMLDMAGVSPLPGQHIDGKSLVPLLTEERWPGREAIFWHYPHYSNQGGKPCAAVRCGDYKLIEFFEDGSKELYDLRNDIGETNNLTKSMPEKAQKLSTLLHNWYKEVDAKMPKPNPWYWYEKL